MLSLNFMLMVVRFIINPLLKLFFRLASLIGIGAVRGRLVSIIFSIQRRLYPASGPAIETVKVDDNMRVSVNLHEWEGRNLFFGVAFEPVEVSLVEKFVRPGGVFIDVGANLGFYSLWASRLIGANGMVHAFEPASNSFKLLQSNIRRNKMTNIVANKVALSDREGEGELYVNRESGLSSLGETERGLIVGIENVQCISLDYYLAQVENQQADFLKIDVEGFEGHVLKGAKELLKRENDIVVMCELAQKNFRPLNISVNEILDWMRLLGFDIWEIDQASRLLLKIDIPQDSYQNQNFLFARPSADLYQAIINLELSKI